MFAVNVDIWPSPNISRMLRFRSKYVYLHLHIQVHIYTHTYTHMHRYTYINSKMVNIEKLTAAERGRMNLHWKELLFDLLSNMKW